MLGKKDSEETTAIEELREQAKKELADWYKHSDEQLQATKATNRYNISPPYLCPDKLYKSLFYKVE